MGTLRMMGLQMNMWILSATLFEKSKAREILIQTWLERVMMNGKGVCLVGDGKFWSNALLQVSAHFFHNILGVVEHSLYYFTIYNSNCDFLIHLQLLNCS